MSAEWVRHECMSMPHVTEEVLFGNHLVFKIGGKMFAIKGMDPGDHYLSLKVSAEDFAELTERPGIIPAPYLARAQWVALESEFTLPRTETAQLLRQAWALIFAKLPKKQQAALSAGAAATSS